MDKTVIDPDRAATLARANMKRAEREARIARLARERREQTWLAISILLGWASICLIWASQVYAWE